jgi:glutamate synthase domain-containing protein 3
MMRKCHANTCPVGVATQDPRMRARFGATPEHVKNFFLFVARELREIMAYAGFRTMSEMTGQVDRLIPKTGSQVIAERGLDFSRVLHKPQGGPLRFVKYAPKPPADTLDDRLLPKLAGAIETGEPVTVSERVKNTDRTIGAKISSRIVRRHALAGLPDGTITLKLTGIAGQSFGAFCARGLTLDLAGEANDYVGKGLSGGRLIIRPPEDAHPDFVPSLNSIAGNVALYGATSGELYMCGLAGLPDGLITLKLSGIAGQSFGAFAARGLCLDLSGEANDYVGKGLSGGRLIIKPPRDIHPDFVPELNTIAGNVALYGATSGELYMNGLAGERFGVRNSGALAVVEGVGDHGCEYMTGGRVVVLGKTGVNFAAGMSGGLAYVYDEDGFFDNHCNLEMVDLDLLEPDDELELKVLISRHAHFTGSSVARRILRDWHREKEHFVKVFPMEYRQGIALESRKLSGIPMVELAGDPEFPAATGR